MWEVAKDFVADIGSNIFQNVDQMITFQLEPFFTLRRRDSDGQLGIDLDVMNPDGSKAATVRNARIVQGDPERFAIGRADRIHELIDKHSGEPILVIERDAPAAELKIAMNLLLPFPGMQLKVDRDAIYVLNEGTRVGEFRDNKLRNVKEGIRLTVNYADWAPFGEAPKYPYIQIAKRIPDVSAAVDKAAKAILRTVPAPKGPNPFADRALH